MRKIFLISLLPYLIYAQGVFTLFGNGTFHTWDAITLWNNKSSDHVALYGDFNRNVVPKDSMADYGNGLVRAGTKSASEYMRVWGDSILTYSTGFDNSASIGYPWQIFTTSTPKYFYGVDSLSVGRNNALLIYNNSYPSANGKFAEAILLPRLNRTYVIYYQYFIPNPNDTTEGLKLVPLGNGDFGNAISYNMVKGIWTSKIDTFKSAEDYFTLRWLEIWADDSTYQYANGSGEYFLLDSVKLYEYYGTANEPFDSVRTRARIIYFSDLIEDHRYYYDCVVKQPNGRYSDGADSTFTTPFPSPSLFASPDTAEIDLSVFANSIDGVEDRIIFYVDNVSIDTFTLASEWGDFSYSTLDGHWYKVKAEATYSSEWSDSLYLTPIEPPAFNLTVPTSVGIIGDTTGAFITWTDGLNGNKHHIQKREISEGNFVTIDSVANGVEQYCDSIPSILTNTIFEYRIINTNYVANAISDTVQDTVTYSIYEITSGGLYSNTGNNLTGFTKVVEEGNNVTVQNTGGNPDYTLQYDYSGTNDRAYIYRSVSTTDTLWVRADIYIPDNFTISASQTNNFVLIYNGAVNAAFLSGRNNAGTDINQWRIGGGGVTIVSNTNGFAVDQWVKITMAYLNAGAGAGVVKFYAGNSLISQQTGLTLTQATVNTVRFGESSIGSNPDDADYWKLDNMYFALDSAGLYTIGDTILVDFNCAQDTVGPTPRLPDQVTGLDSIDFTITATNAEIIWNDLDDSEFYDAETGYRIYGKQSGSFALLGTNAANDTTFIVSPLNADLLTYVYVDAITLAGNGVNSDTLTFTTDPAEGGGSEGGITFDLEATSTGVGATYTFAEAYALVGTTINGNLVDTVYFNPSTGVYSNIASNNTWGSSSINFSKSGTESNPIVWMGIMSNGAMEHRPLYNGDPVAPLDSVTTMFVNYLSQNDAINMSGNWNEFHHIYFYQGYGTSGWQLIQPNGDNITFDSCVVAHNITDIASSSNHTFRTGADCDDLKLLNSRFYGSSKTGIWIESGLSTASDNFLMDGCIVDDMNNHPCIQIMPQTNVNGLRGQNATIRNSILRSSYSGVYTRHQANFQYYNNVGIINGQMIDIEYQPTYNDTSNGEGAIVAYNTLIYGGGASVNYNKAINDIDFVNNIVYFTSDTWDYFFRYTKATIIPAGREPILRHRHNYNLWFDPNETLATGRNKVIWGTGVNYTWSAYKTNTGFEASSIIDQNPSFNDNLSLITNTNTSLTFELVSSVLNINIGSPPVFSGTPVTTDNYLINISTDFNGNPRDATNPTMGAMEYAP